MGFVIIVALQIYALLSLIVIVLTVHYAKKRGKSGIKWGFGAAFIMYNLAFWDWIPTVVAHKYYCATQAGFWVYKTVDQWKEENPGVMETLVYKKDMPHLQTQYGSATELNNRFLYIYKNEGPLLFNRWRIDKEIRDRKNGEVIAREVDFSTSQERRKADFSGWKFWLDCEHCDTENHRDRGSFDQITLQVEGAKK